MTLAGWGIFSYMLRNSYRKGNNHSDKWRPLRDASLINNEDTEATRPKIGKKQRPVIVENIVEHFQMPPGILLIMIAKTNHFCRNPETENQSYPLSYHQLFPFLREFLF